MPAFEDVIPMADHRVCVRHLWASFRDEGHRGVALKDKLWAAACAYTKAEFNAHMQELKRMSPAAFEYLDKIDPSGWSRAWFHDYPKCDLLVNNICEYFNAYILKARDKPILTMLEMIRIKLMRRYQVKRDGISKLTGKLCPKVVKKLESIGLDAMECVPHFAGENFFEVEAPRRLRYVVDLHKKTCGCRQWEMTGIPCAHAVSTILFDCRDPEDYVHEYYSLEMYKKAYAPLIYPMPSEEQWVHAVGHDILEPPRQRVATGRLRKLRRRCPDESRDPKNPNRIRKFGARMRCSKCVVVGHNKRACPLNGAGPSAQASQSGTEVECPSQPAASVS